MNKTFFNALTILLSGLFFFFSCTSTKEVFQPKDLDYLGVQNFKLQKMSLSKPIVGMELKFFNPNKVSLDLKDADIDVYISKNFAGKITTNKLYTIPARDTFLLPISLEVDMNKLLPNAIDILTKKSIDYRLHGNVKAGKGVFMKVPVDFSGSHKLEF